MISFLLYCKASAGSRRYTLKRGPKGSVSPRWDLKKATSGHETTSCDRSISHRPCRVRSCVKFHVDTASPSGKLPSFMDGPTQHGAFFEAHSGRTFGATGVSDQAVSFPRAPTGPQRSAQRFGTSPPKRPTCRKNAATTAASRQARTRPQTPPAALATALHARRRPYRPINCALRCPQAPQKTPSPPYPCANTGKLAHVTPSTNTRTSAMLVRVMPLSPRIPGADAPNPNGPSPTRRNLFPRRRETP